MAPASRPQGRSIPGCNLDLKQFFNVVAHLRPEGQRGRILKNIEKFDLRANLPWFEFRTVSRVYYILLDDGRAGALAIGSDAIGLFLIQSNNN